MGKYDDLFDAGPTPSFSPGTTVPQVYVDEASQRLAEEKSSGVGKYADLFDEPAPAPSNDVARALEGTAQAKKALGLLLDPLGADWSQSGQALPRGTDQLDRRIAEGDQYIQDARGLSPNRPGPETGGPITSVNGPARENQDELAHLIPNEKLRHAVAASANLIGGLVPSSLEGIKQMLAPPTYERFQEDVARSKPEYEAVEKTPPWSQERFEHYGNTALQILMAGAVGKGVLKPEPKLSDLDAKIAEAQAKYEAKPEPASTEAIRAKLGQSESRLPVEELYPSETPAVKEMLNSSSLDDSLSKSKFPDLRPNQGTIAEQSAQLQASPSQPKLLAVDENASGAVPTQVISGEYQTGTAFSPLGDTIRRRINAVADRGARKADIEHPQKGIWSVVNADTQYAYDYAKEQAAKFPDDASAYNRIVKALETEIPALNKPKTEPNTSHIPAANESASGAEPSKVASVPVMITKQMEADLRARGVTDEQIYKMTPAEAHEILNPAPEPVVTSTKNAVTGAEREARSLPEAEQAARRDFGTVWDEAAAVTEKDPTAPTRLVDELQNKPRALNDRENALLLRKQIEVQNEHDAAIQNQNENPGNPDAQTRLDTARDELQKVYDAGKAAGTETGRGLNARKMLAANDFSLAKMEAETRAVVNKGEPLSGKQAADIKALHERIATAETKLAGYEAQEQFRAELKAAKAQKQPQPEFLRQSYEAAKTRITNRRGRLYTGVDPTALVDEAIVGAYHISRGVAKFADWSVEMVKEFGEAIKPHLQAIFEKARALHSETNRSRGPLTEEQRLGMAKSRTSLQTEIIRKKLETGDTSKTERRAPVTPDKELTSLRFERDKAKDAYHRMLVEAQLKQRSVPRKILGGVGEVFNTTRALMTSFDLSAVLRQGGFVAFGHPIRAAKAFPAMFRALASEKGQFRVNEEIRNRPNAPLYAQSKLYLAQDGPGVSLSRMEEAYMGRWAKKIPGIGASERAYTTFLNRLRADSFDAMSASLAKNGKPTLEESRAIANYVNVATGRGEMGKYATAAEALNKLFFAPRYVLSRFQLLLGQPLYGGTLRTRTLIAGEYARMLAGAATVYGLGIAAGGKIETDSRSTDFGKIRFGNTRVDPLFGMSQTTVLMSRLAQGSTKQSSSGKIVPISGPKVPYGGSTAFGLTTDFLRGKLAPIPGAVVNLRQGEDVVGQPVTLKSTAANLLQPISFQDIYKTMQEQGVPKGTAFGVLSLLGMGLQTYQPRKSKSAQRTLDLNESIMRRNLQSTLVR